MILEVHTNPCRYKLKGKKHNMQDMLSVSSFIHTYLSDGGDPRRIHLACRDLALDSNLGVSTKITHSNVEIQRTVLSVTINESEDAPNWDY